MGTGIARALVVTCVASMVVLGAGGAKAQERPTAIVLGLDSPPASIARAGEITSAIRAEARAAGRWTMLERDVSLAALLATHGCTEPDDVCMARVALALEVDRVIFGVLVEVPGSGDSAVELHTYDAYRARRVAGLAERVPATDDTGALTIRSARWLDALAAPPRVGGRAGLPVAREAHDVVPLPAPSSGPRVRTIIGWSLVGAGLASAAVALYSARRIVGINEDPNVARYRSTVVVGRDACVEAQAGRGVAADAAAMRDACDTADVLEPLQWVTLVSALVLTGAGTSLLVFGSDDEDEEARERPQVRVSPVLLPGHASVTGSIQF